MWQISKLLSHQIGSRHPSQKDLTENGRSPTHNQMKEPKKLGGCTTSSSPKECLLLGPGSWGNLVDCEDFVETRINFVSL